MRVTNDDLAKALAGALRAADRVGLDVDGWHVATMGGTFLYLVEPDDTDAGRRVLSLGPTRRAAFDRLHALAEDLAMVDLERLASPR